MIRIADCSGLIPAGQRASQTHEQAFQPFASVLAALNCAGAGEHSRADDITPEQEDARPLALAPDDVAPLEAKTPSTAQSFASTGPLGLARPTDPAFARGAGSPCAQAESLAETYADQVLGSPARPRAAPLDRLPSGADETLAAAPAIKSEAKSAVALSGPTNRLDATPHEPVPLRLTTMTKRGAAPAASIPPQRPANPNTLLLRLVEEAGAIGVRATVSAGAVEDSAALAAEVERTLQEHAREGALFINGRRIHARKEGFDV